MKSFIQKQDGIMSVPIDFANLEAIENNKFRYKIRYLIDPVAAVQNEALLVKIQVCKGPYLKKLQPIFNASAAIDVIRNVLRKSSLQKDIARTAVDDSLLTLRSDVSSRIPNNTSQRLSSALFGQIVPIRINKTVTTRPVAELTDLNLSLPVHDTNLNRTSTTTAFTSDTSIRREASSLLYGRKIDPASLTIGRSNTLVSARTTTAGIIAPVPFSETRFFTNNPSSQIIITSLLSNTFVTNQHELGLNDHLNVVQEHEQTLVAVEEFVEIPVAAIPSAEFYIVFHLVNRRGLEIQTVSSLVKHLHNVQILQMPTKPPDIKSFPVNKPGKVVFEVTQRDRNAKGVLIYRRELKPNAPVVDATYTHVGKVDVAYNHPAHRVEDLVASINPIIYRFIPYNDDSVPSSVFSSTVVQFQRQNIAKQSHHNLKQSFVSMDYTIKENAITIDVKDFPADIIAMRLQRRDLSTKQQTFSVVGRNTYLLDSNSSAPISIDDTTVKDGHIYEYRTELIYRSGSEQVSSKNLIVEYNPIVSNIATTVISNPEIVHQNEGLDAVFKVTFSILNQNMDLIKRFLGDQGLLSEFQDEITASRDKLTRLFAYGVVRTNLTTGDIENFGIIDSPDFSDRKYGIAKNVKPLDPGAEYRYTIITYFRNPETLFATATRTVTSSVTGASYSFSPYRWLQPITLRTGNLVSDGSIKRNHPKTTFEQGQVADVQTINLSLGNFLPSLENGLATRVRNNAIMVQWKVDGVASKIDHFIVILENLGIRTVVGTTHNISNSNYFQFLDSLDNGEQGALTYIIVPVYYDYSRGTELKTNTVVI